MGSEQLYFGFIQDTFGITSSRCCFTYLYQFRKPLVSAFSTKFIPKDIQKLIVMLELACSMLLYSEICVMSSLIINPWKVPCWYHHVSLFQVGEKAREAHLCYIIVSLGQNLSREKIYNNHVAWMLEIAGFHSRNLVSFCSGNLCMHGELPNVSLKQTTDTVKRAVRTILPRNLEYQDIQKFMISEKLEMDKISNPYRECCNATCATEQWHLRTPSRLPLRIYRTPMDL